VEKSSFHLLVDGIRVTDGHLARGEGSSLELLGPVYLGADLKSKTTKVCIAPHVSFTSRFFYRDDTYTFLPLRSFTDPLLPPSGTRRRARGQRDRLRAELQDERGGRGGTGGELQNG